MFYFTGPLYAPFETHLRCACSTLWEENSFSKRTARKLTVAELITFFSVFKLHSYSLTFTGNNITRKTSGWDRRIASAVRYFKHVLAESLWPTMMFNRSRKQRSPVRHCTYVRATNNLHQREGDWQWTAQWQRQQGQSRGGYTNIFTFWEILL